jgi:hypothetical protein
MLFVGVRARLIYVKRPGPRGLLLANLGFAYRPVVVEKNLECRAFQIVELAVAHRVPENARDQQNQHDRQWNQEVKDVHRYAARDASVWRFFPEAARVLRASRPAFSTTRSELAAMPIPAIQGVTQPAMAAGTASAL